MIVVALLIPIIMIGFGLLFPIIPTERALRRSFDINGRPKA